MYFMRTQPERGHLPHDSVKAISAFNGLNHLDEASHPPPKFPLDWTAVGLPPVRHRTEISHFIALPSPHATIWLECPL